MPKLSNQSASQAQDSGKLTDILILFELNERTVITICCTLCVTLEVVIMVVLMVFQVMVL